MKELLKIQFPGDAELLSLSHQNDVSVLHYCIISFEILF